MRTYPTAIEGSMVNYENMDNAQTGIHDYFKFLKFGFSRTTDFACLHIRRGRLRRSDALSIVRERDGKFPWTYLGYKIEDILRDIDVSLDEFISIVTASPTNGCLSVTHAAIPSRIARAT